MNKVEIDYGQCKNGARLYAQKNTQDWFHDQKCIKGCLPINVRKGSNEI